MPRSRTRPTYQRHAGTGQARTHIDGKDYYLGPFDSPESHRKFAELVARWAADSEFGSYRIRIDDLAILYVEHADAYYRKPDGTPTGESSNVRDSLRPLIQHFGTQLAVEFSPKRFKDYRQFLVVAGVVRTSINRHMARIRAMFRWGVENDHVPVLVWQALTAVKGLAAGRSKAIEPQAVRPVADALVDAIRPFVSRQVWACVQLQRLTGCRPGEVLQMRGCDLKTDEDVWEFRPESHKTQHHNKRRVVFLGPLAKSIAKEFLKADPMAYMFSPADARAEWLEKRTGPGRLKRLGTENRQAKLRYSTCTYGVAIRRGCERAFAMPDELRRISKKLPPKEIKRLKTLAAAWRATHCWHPHQLRHTAATAFRKEAGIETARAVLGHSSIAMSELYAEQDDQKARAVVSRIG